LRFLKRQIFHRFLAGGRRWPRSTIIQQYLSNSDTSVTLCSPRNDAVTTSPPPTCFLSFVWFWHSMCVLSCSFSYSSSMFFDRHYCYLFWCFCSRSFSLSWEKFSSSLSSELEIFYVSVYIRVIKSICSVLYIPSRRCWPSTTQFHIPVPEF